MATAGAEKEVLVEIATRYGEELAEGAERLRAKSEGAAATLGESVGRAQARLNSAKPQLDDTVAALTELSPVPAEAGTSRPIHESLVWSAVMLAALSIAQTAGRYLGGVALSWWLSGGVATLGALVGVPAAYAAYEGTRSLGPKERRAATMAAAAGMGVLSGYALRLYGTPTWETAAVVPLVVAAGLRVAAAPLAAQADRKALIGATLGGAAGVQLTLALLAGTLDASTVVYTAGSVGVIGAGLQLSLWRQARPSEANEWVDSLLPMATVAAVTALDALLSATIAPSIEAATAVPAPAK